MGFNANAKYGAFRRQFSTKADYVCAKCCRPINRNGAEGKDWFAIPLIPTKVGGNKSNNCAIVCHDCNDKLAQDGTKYITKDELPCFGSKGKKVWYEKQ